jgi:hypothetical protein
LHSPSKKYRYELHQRAAERRRRLDPEAEERFDPLPFPGTSAPDRVLFGAEEFA